MSSGDARRPDKGSSSLASALLRIEPFTTTSSAASSCGRKVPCAPSIKSSARVRRGTDCVKLADAPLDTWLRLMISRLSWTIAGALASHTVVSRAVPGIWSLRYNDVHENEVGALLSSLCVLALPREASSAGTVGFFAN